MAGSKSELVHILRECAFLMELNGENPFRCRAYENGARVLEGVEGEPTDWIANGTLEGVKGIGKGLLEHIQEYVNSGTIETYRELREKIPAGLIEMTNIPGLGPKKIKSVWENLGIDTIEKLEAASKDGSVAALAGFGEKTAEKILAGIEQRRSFSGRHRLDVAHGTAELVLAHLKKLKSIRRMEVAGSLRRRRETVKDLDFVVDSDNPAEVMDAFVTTPHVLRVVNHGETKSSVLFDNGVPVDLRVVAHDEYAAALNYFTGSKEHNTHLRGRAKKMGLKLNEYGLFPTDSAVALPCPDEAKIYERLGLDYVEPELREDVGEIEAAETHTLPKLITMKDMKGLLHCHSTYSDGKSTLREMTLAARGAGYSYFGICDHSKSAAYAGGLREDTVKRQHEEIAMLNDELGGITILKGIESDILGDGALDYDNPFLDSFDFIVASIHSRFQMTREEMTARVCRAVQHPATVILGHPTGRLLLEREPFQIDLERVFEVAAASKVAIEINASPWRLDLDWKYIRQAKKAGCLFSINPDAHHVLGIPEVEHGIGIARKGWLGPEDVINTLTLEQFRSWLGKRKQGRTPPPGQIESSEPPPSAPRKAARKSRAKS